MSKSLFALLVVLSLAQSAWAEPGMAEVNAARAKRGLPPFVEDPELTKGAEACAEYRAKHGIREHTRNDFGFLPQGAVAWGAGAGWASPDYGWLSCFTYDRRYRTAGAAWHTGRDGMRYMTLFVR